MFNLSIISLSAFVSSLPTLLIGMIGIFVVIGVIVICVILMEKLFPADRKPRVKKNKKAKKSAAGETSAE